MSKYAWRVFSWSQMTPIFFCLIRSFIYTGGITNFLVVILYGDTNWFNDSGNCIALIIDQMHVFSYFFPFSAHEVTHAFDQDGIEYDSFGSRYRMARFGFYSHEWINESFHSVFSSPIYDEKTVQAFANASTCIRCYEKVDRNIY